MTLDHYRLLGISPDAPIEAIERVYRRTVARIHPDKFSTDPGLQVLAEQKMRQVNVAMQVLRDPARRANYDDTLTDRALAAPPLTRRLRATCDRYLGQVEEEL